MKKIERIQQREERKQEKAAENSTSNTPQVAAQSTALVCNDVPQDIGDWYRLLLVLWYSEKPVVTGAFSAQSLHTLIDLLTIESGAAKTSGVIPVRFSMSAPLRRSTGRSSLHKILWIWRVPAYPRKSSVCPWQVRPRR